MKYRKTLSLGFRPVSYLFAVSTLISTTAIAQTTPESSSSTSSSEVTQLDKLQVIGRRTNLVGEAISASEGVIGQQDIADRPNLRTGDLLERVPGLIATAHSGSGKANQYFLRGFNLDHGTDFSTQVDGMPVNLRTHGHGQGYTDLNFLIAETVETLAYRKGIYYADTGDFSSAGSAQFHLPNRVEDGTLNLTVGEQGYARVAAVDSTGLGGGDFLYGGEAQTYDGPWTDINEDVRKFNLLLRYSWQLGNGRAHVNLMGYDNRWNSADQIPQRAVTAGLISEFGSLDTTLGGESSRYSLSAGWAGHAFNGDLELDVYTIDYAMQLWSNFTYDLESPEDGDQFEQVDDRRIHGFNASQQWQSGRSRWRVGSEGRFDDIARVALLRTIDRVPTGTVRDDAVQEGSVGVHAAHEFQFNPQWRSYLGLRRDEYRFEVDSSLSVNSGKASDGITSYKGSLAYRPNEETEWYASYGTGFHSNDARGTTITMDPVTGDPADTVDPLVGSRGGEVGLRLHLNDRLQTTLAVWTLHLDSELLFVGDAGTTEASRPSRRDGAEWGLYWFPNPRFTANLEAAYTHARFDDNDPAGNEIPGAIPLVIGAGFTAHFDSGWLASAQLKHFGEYPLIEDGHVESAGSSLLNLRMGRQWQRWSVYLDVLNALDSDDHDIDYYYASRLPGESAEGVEDIHFHVFPSRELRLGLTYRY